jgi:hypothetical protein
MRNAFIILLAKEQGEKHLGDNCRWEDNIVTC